MFRVIASGVVAAAFTASGLTAANAAPATAPAHRTSDRPLRNLAAADGLRVGTAVDMTALADDPAYRRLVGSQFSTVTAENVMKWESIEPQRGVYDYTAADRLVGFAEQHGQKVRGHTLLWHNQLPAWLTSGDFSADELRSILHKHITDTVSHFRGKVWQWDVVNEAFNDDGSLRDTIWLQKLGPGYIADAFRWAHQADPKAKLFYNDYSIEGSNAKSDAIYALVRQLRAEHVPIDGVGFQSHLGTQYGFPGDMAANMRRFDDLGLDTAVTEADVRVVMPADDDKLQAQAQGYSLLMSSCLATPHCISFTVWGFTDRYSWVPDTFPGQGAANLLDEDYGVKPAYTALQTTLAEAHGRRGK